LRGDGERYSPRAMNYDSYYDVEADMRFAEAQAQKVLKKGNRRHARLIIHPSFKNVDHSKVRRRRVSKTAHTHAHTFASLPA
jgi:hypothetical protein